jgi:hypothetical protein
MSTNVNVNELSPQARIYSGGGTRAAIGFLIAIGLAFLLGGAIYYSSLDPAALIALQSATTD